MNKDNVESVKTTASAIAGSIVEAVTGGVTLGAAGAVVGKVVGDVGERFLSKKEKNRIANAEDSAKSLIKTRLDSGEQLRNDDFFQTDQNLAEEVFEGVLLTAKNTWEEKKVPYLGYFFANIAFDETCKQYEANQLLRLAESLSYPQMVLLSLFDRNDNKFNLSLHPLISMNSSLQQNIGGDSEALVITICELCNSFNLVKIDHQGGRIRQAGTNELLTDIIPAQAKLSKNGKRLHDLLALSKIPDQDLEHIAQYLRLN